MLNFGEDNLGRFFEFGCHANFAVMVKIMREMGLETLNDYNHHFGDIIASLIAFGYKRSVPVIDSTTGQVEIKNYIIHPPNSIFAEILNEYNQYSIDSEYFNMVFEFLKTTFLKEYVLSDFLEEMTFESQFEDRYHKYDIYGGKTRLEEILGLELDQFGSIIFENDKITIDATKEIYDLPNVYKIPGRNRKDQSRLKWIIKEIVNEDEIFEAIKDVYGIEINDHEDLIDKKDQLTEAIFKKYESKLKLTKNEKGEIEQTIGFNLFEFTQGNKEYIGFMVSINGQQFMPGTYEKSDGTIVYNPSALINAIFPPIWSGENYAYSHAERKILITLYCLFGENIQDLKMTMITNREFCPACLRMIIDFIDIYHRAYFMDNSKTILQIPIT